MSCAEIENIVAKAVSLHQAWLFLNCKFDIFSILPTEIWLYMKARLNWLKLSHHSYVFVTNNGKQWVNDLWFTYRNAIPKYSFQRNGKAGNIGM